MKLRFRQSGGFAGLIRGYEIDTDSLSPEEAGSLLELVNKSGLLDTVKEPNPEARDLIGYEVTVETSEGVFQAAFDDLSMPKDAAALLEFLRGKAQPRTPK